MTAKTFRKWCPTCKKLVDVSCAEEKCPSCGIMIPIPPHEKFGYASPPALGPVPPVAQATTLPRPAELEPKHEDIIEILDRIEKRIDELAKKTK